MRKLIFLALFLSSSSLWGQLFQVPNLNFPRPRANALGISRWDAPWNSNPDLWIIVSTISPSPTLCVSTAFNVCFPSGIAISLGNINAGTLTLTTTQPLIIAPSTPSSSSAACTQGQIWTDVTYIYVCTATNTIKRVALTTF